jgi:hypothetical protein
MLQLRENGSPKEDKWSNNIKTVIKQMNKVITRAETKVLLQEIIDLTGFQECTNNPEKKYKFGLMASEAASDSCEDVLHILPNKDQCSRQTTHSRRLMHHRTLPPSCLYP